jgi:hypothetical protein
LVASSRRDLFYVPVLDFFFKVYIDSPGMFYLGTSGLYKLGFSHVPAGINSLLCKMLQDGDAAGRWCLTSVILATQEAEIRRITIQSQRRQVVHETLSRKSPTQKKAGRMVQGISPQFKPQYRKSKKRW